MNHFANSVTVRHCARCQLPLTDPASRECGVGPVCRNRDNHLYAKTIQANLPIAGALILGTHAGELPHELAERFDLFQASFTKKMQKVQKHNDALLMQIAGADFRNEIRELEYFLSYAMSTPIRTRLISIVEALGYSGLSGVLSGDASKSEAKVWFDNGCVWLAGTSSKTGFFHMKKIPGIQVPRYRGDKTPYSAPASEAEAFCDVVRKFWPLYDADLDAIKTQAATWVTANPPQVAQPVAKETAQIVMRSDDFTLSFPWRREANMFALVNGLKEVPYKDRKYIPSTKSWSFKMEHLAHVRRHVEKIFDDAAVVTSSEQTPAGLYAVVPAPRKARRPRRYGYRY